MVKTWEDKEGMNKKRIAAYVCKHYQGSSGRYASSYWHYDSMNTTGFFPWTQLLDRYHLALKDNSRTQVKAVVRFDVGVKYFFTQEIPKLFEFDHRLIVKLPIGRSPPDIASHGLPIPYEKLALSLLMSESDFLWINRKSFSPLGQ